MFKVVLVPCQSTKVFCSANLVVGGANVGFYNLVTQDVKIKKYVLQSACKT